MIIDEQMDAGNDENFAFEDYNNEQIPSYMFNSYGNFVKVWEFIITGLLIYDFIMVPFIMTF
jgi:hypothetical protein